MKFKFYNKDSGWAVVGNYFIGGEGKVWEYEDDGVNPSLRLANEVEFKLDEADERTNLLARVDELERKIDKALAKPPQTDTSRADIPT